MNTYLGKQFKLEFVFLKINENTGNCLHVVLNVPLDPVSVLPHFGVDTRIEWICTANTPGNDALKATIADQWTTGVTLWIHQEKISNIFLNLK